MSAKESQRDWNQVVVRVLAFVGVINCVVVPTLFAQQRPLFPLPGLYLIEIAIFGVLGLAGLLVASADTTGWRALPWAAAGVLLAFNLLGGFSIGFYLIPATAAFLLAGFLSDRAEGYRISRHVGLFLITAVSQVLLMLILVQVRIS